MWRAGKDMKFSDSACCVNSHLLRCQRPAFRKVHMHYALLFVSRDNLPYGLLAHRWQAGPPAARYTFILGCSPLELRTPPTVSFILRTITVTLCEILLNFSHNITLCISILLTLYCIQSKQIWVTHQYEFCVSISTQ